MPIDQLQQMLPIWPDDVRGGPNPLLRSAFFAAVASKHRKIFENRTTAAEEPEGILIAAQDGVAIKYTGTQLNQYDADVFFEILHRSRRSPLGTVVCFTGAEFLESIGRVRNNLNYQDLDMSLRRLKRGTVDVAWRSPSSRPMAYTGSLLAEVERDTESKLYKVSLFPKIKVLFEPSTFTYLQWPDRKKLIRAPLAQWLHSFFSTHAKPFPISVDWIQDKSGHGASRRADFLRTLRKAIEVLQVQLDWQIEWTDDDRLKITHATTESQKRHIGRAEKRRAVIEANKQRGLLFR
ncbi:hypothetical protein HDF16_005472 [Granulicella aggregans]|uniref:TrfA protein n=1 Tax=Granulicella aggregans TaxID=474949 RepID=A0A7W8E6J1_9BACT|nr:plasmid replication initiator TrfA [Granulicella aggregans]MBB5060736.1 hypothetical protein [Granulicella aggregans]